MTALDHLRKADAELAVVEEMAKHTAELWWWQVLLKEVQDMRRTINPYIDGSNELRSKPPPPDPFEQWWSEYRGSAYLTKEYARAAWDAAIKHEKEKAQ